MVSGIPVSYSTNFLFQQNLRNLSKGHYENGEKLQLTMQWNHFYRLGLDLVPHLAHLLYSFCCRCVQSVVLARLSEENAKASRLVETSMGPSFLHL